MAVTRRWVVVGILLSAILSFMYMISASVAPAQPFMITERTEYGIAENDVYLTFTDTSDKAQYITNITFVFADSDKTRTIAISDFLLKQSYLKDVYGYSNVSLGTYSKIETNCTTHANMTQTCRDYYMDDSGNVMACDYVLADKSCLKTVYGVVGTVMASDYLPTPNTKQKTVTNGLKIEQKVEGSVPLAKGGTAEIKVKMPHQLFYGITVADWENKYSIIACSQYGCSELDPLWWDESYSFRWPIYQLGNLSIPFSVNNTGLVYGKPVFGRADNNSYLYCNNAACSGAYAIANESVAANYEVEGGNGYGIPTLWNRMYGVWHMNGTATQLDSSPNARSCTYGGTAAVSKKAVYGNGAEFASDSTSTSTCVFAQINSGNDFSVSAWANATDNTLPTAGCVFCARSSGGVYFDVDTNNLWNWYVYDGSWNTVTHTIHMLEWHHYVLTWSNSANIAIVYEDGTQIGSFASTQNSALAGSDELGDQFPGVLDEIQVYNYALSPTEIYALYNNGLTNHNYTAFGTVEAISVALTINSPINMTYNYSAIKINGTVSIPSNVSYSVDGGGNLTACLICTVFENFTTLTDGAHVIRIYANKSTDGTQRDNKTVYLTVDTAPPYITIVNPSGTYVQNSTIPLNYTANDTYSPISKCWYSLNNASNVSLAGCANTTLTITQAGTHNVSVFANDTVNNTNGTSKAFIYDPFQNFTANDTLDGSNINIFQVLIPETAAIGSTTNGTVPMPLSAIGYGSRTVRFISTGYGTKDFVRVFDNGTLQKENYTLTPASIRITIYDESQAALGVWANLTFNITITNSTTATTWYNQSNFFKRVNETPINEITADITKDGYQPRRYYFMANANTANNFTGYLLPIADALFVRFHIHTTTESLITGASVNASRFLGSGWSIVSQQTSDESGIAAMYLYPFATYIIAAGKTGFTATSITIQPSATDYIITLQTAGAAEAFETATTNVTVAFTPAITSLNASLNAFMCQVNSTDNSLQYVNFNITHYNGTVWYANSSAVTSNISLSTSIDLTAENGTNLTALCSFRRVGFGWVLLNRTYYVYNITGGALEQGAAAAAAQYSRMTLGLISIIITAIAAGGIGGIGRNTLAGALAGLITLGIFTFSLGWFDWQVYILICTVFGAIMYLRSGV